MKHSSEVAVRTVRLTTKPSTCTPPPPQYLHTNFQICTFQAAYRRLTANTEAVVVILTERQDSASVGIAGRSGDRIPVEARFSAPVQTGPEAHPDSYKMGTGSFTGEKRPGRGVDHPPPSIADVKERVEIYLYSSSGPSWPVLWSPLPLHLAYC